MKESYKSLIQYPSVKEVQVNDWMEYDGLEADLSRLSFNPKQFTLTFAFIDASYRDFVSFLKSSAYLTMNFAEIGVIKTARLLGFVSLNRYDPSSKLTVSFVEDNPVAGEVTVPSATIQTNQKLKLDGVPFSDFNARLLKGTDAAIGKPADLKQYLLRTSAHSSGQTYDQPPFDTYEEGEWSQSHEGQYGDIRVKEREVTFPCLITADTLPHFFGYYNGLLYALTHKNDEQAEEDETTAYMRHFLIDEERRQFNSYYKSQTVNNFYPYGSNKVWCQFNLTMCLLSADAETFARLLASEASYYVITESGLYISV